MYLTKIIAIPILCVISSHSYSSGLTVTAAEIESYPTYDCNQLDKSLKRHTIRLKQLNSEIKEIGYRNSSVGLVSFFFFAPAILALDSSSNERSEIQLLSKALTSIKKFSDEKSCVNVKKRIARFEQYLNQI